MGLTQDEFGALVGYVRNTIINIENGIALGENTLLRLSNKLNINIDWLQKGEGMQKLESTYTINENNFKVNEPKTEYNLKNNLPKGITLYDPQENLESSILVPFIPYRARAGIDMGMDNIDQLELEMIYLNPEPIERKLKDLFVIEVDGDSMQPHYIPNDRLLCKIINPEDWQYQNNDIFVFWFRDTFTIKRIYENNLSVNETLSLFADNDEKFKLTINGSDIRYMFKIIRIASGAKR